MLRAVFFASCAILAALGGCTSTPGTRRPGSDGGGSDPDAAPPVFSDAGPLPDRGPPPEGDADADGLPDSAELARGTDPNNPDTDGDGVTDGVEAVAGTNPLDATSTIPPTDFYVVLPYMDPPIHRELVFTARLGRGDIFFLVDTTGSMGLAIMNVRSSLSGTIVPAIQAAIADAVMGVGDFRDFPVSPYGDPGDWTLNVRQPMTADVPAVQAALDRLAAGGGNDGPEASSVALHDSAAGTCPGGSGFGAACFRASSHPIIVHVTDAPFHNGTDPANAYDPALVTAPSWAATLAALNAQSVKIVGVAIDPTPPGLPPGLIPIPSRPDLEALATATSSRSSAGALTVYNASGGSVSTAVVDGIVDLVGGAVQDVSARSLDDTSDSVDATRFIRAITPVRATRATSFDATTFYGVAAGTTVTFDVTFENDFQQSTDRVQIFRAYIEVFDVASGTALDRRNVYIVVPAVGGVLI